MPRDLTTRMTLCRFKDFSSANLGKILNVRSVSIGYFVAAVGAAGAVGAAPGAGVDAAGAFAVVDAGWSAGLIQQACARPVSVLSASGPFRSIAGKRVRQRNAA